MRLFHKALQRLRSSGARTFAALVRKPWWRLQGMTIGRGASLARIDANWPHKIAIGPDCVVEPGVAFKFDGIWSPGRAIVVGAGSFVGRGTEFNITRGIDIGAGALIGSGCRFVDHDHGIDPGVPMGRQPSPGAAIRIGHGAWLGANVVVLAGVEVGDGAVVGAGAVVTRSVPAGEIWAGVPARRIGVRARRSAAAPLEAVR
jgi:acetyltransferase-like isoleucine patch superfamily enzyme